MKIYFLEVLLKFVDTFQFWLKSDKSKGNFKLRSTRVSACESDSVWTSKLDGRLRNSSGNSHDDFPSKPHKRPRSNVGDP
jgi:hypothetical protein